nr:hypothetical protein [Cryptosporangium arvum]
MDAPSDAGIVTFLAAGSTSVTVPSTNSVFFWRRTTSRTGTATSPGDRMPAATW